jgi:hypothetical protein
MLFSEQMGLLDIKLFKFRGFNEGLHFLKRGLTLHGQGHKTLGELEDFPWQPPDGGKRR